MATFPLWIFALGALVVGGLIAYQAVADSKRRERLFAAATMRGWTYQPERADLVGRWHGRPFDQGDTRRTRDVVEGVWQGRAFVAFTYSYETHSTDTKGNRTSTTHRHGVVCLELPAWLPRLEVAPESFLHRASAAVGLGSDIELESEEFNRAFQVAAGDAKFASDVLTPRTMEMLLRARREPWRIDGASLLSWDDGPLDLDDIDARLSTLQAVTSSIPAFIWKDHGYDPQQETGGA